MITADVPRTGYLSAMRDGDVRVMPLRDVATVIRSDILTPSGSV